MITAAAPQLGQHFPTVDLRHVHVQKDEVRLQNGMLIECDLAICGAHGPKSFPRQISLEYRDDFRFVFGDKDEFVHILFGLVGWLTSRAS